MNTAGVAMMSVARERTPVLATTALVVTLAATVFFPITPFREGHAALLLTGLVAWRLTAWSCPLRALAVGAALVAWIGARWHLRGLLPLVFVLLAGEAIEALRQRPSLWRPALRAIAVLAVLVAAHGLIQVFGLDPFMCRASPDGTCVGTARAASLLGNANSFGAFLALSVPAVLLLPRWFALPALILMLAGLVAAQSTAPVLALAVAGAVIAWRQAPRWRWALLASGAACLVAWLMFVDRPDLSRWQVWSWAATTVRAHWLLGFGPGAWWAAEVTNQHGLWREAHNEYVQWGFEAGLLGLGTMLLYVGRLLWCTRDAAVLAMLLIGVALAGAHFVAHVAATAAVLILACGLAEGRLAYPED